MTDQRAPQAQSPLEGWICPRCGVVNAPWSSRCACAAVTTSGTTNTPPSYKCPSCGQQRNSYPMTGPF